MAQMPATPRITIPKQNKTSAAPSSVKNPRNSWFGWRHASRMPGPYHESPKQATASGTELTSTNRAPQTNAFLEPLVGSPEGGVPPHRPHREDESHDHEHVKPGEG
jgi:hypothetical protein